MNKYWKLDKAGSHEHWMEIVDVQCGESVWWTAAVRFDGCIHLNCYGNIPYVKGEKRDSEACDDYIHICDLDQYIERLQEMREIAREYLGPRYKEWE